MSSDFKKYRQEHNGITWRDYVDMRLDNSARALDVANSEMNRRLEGMNHLKADMGENIASLRGQIDRMVGIFLTRESYEARHQLICDQIQTLEKTVAASEARGKVYATVVAALISILVALVVYIITGR